MTSYIDYHDKLERILKTLENYSRQGLEDLYVDLKDEEEWSKSRNELRGEVSSMTDLKALQYIGEEGLSALRSLEYSVDLLLNN